MGTHLLGHLLKKTLTIYVLPPCPNDTWQLPLNKRTDRAYKHGAHGILSMSLENSNNISAFNAVDIQK